MRIGRRPLFFAILMVISASLLPATPTEFRWLNIFMAALALFWAVTLSIEELSSAKDAKARKRTEHDPS